MARPKGGREGGLRFSGGFMEKKKGQKQLMILMELNLV
jgi:hypothetical protein